MRASWPPVPKARMENGIAPHAHCLPCCPRIAAPRARFPSPPALAIAPSCIVLTICPGVKRTGNTNRSRRGGWMVEIQLPHGYVAVIDDDDEERVRQHRWRPLVQGRTVYAIARSPRLRGKQRSVYMHRLIVDAKPRERVAHRDRNGLNNTRANLRVRTTSRSGTRRGACLPEGLRWSRYNG